MWLPTAFTLFSGEHIFALVTGAAFMVGGCLLPIVFARLNRRELSRKTRLRVTRVLSLRFSDDGRLVEVRGQETVEFDVESGEQRFPVRPAVSSSAGQRAGLATGRAGHSGGSGSSGGDPGLDDPTILVLAAVGAFAVAAVYVAYYEVIILILGLILGLSLAFAVSVIAYLLRREVVVGAGWAGLLLGSIMVLASGALTLWLVTHPSFHGGGRYSDLFVEARRVGFGAVVGEHGVTLVLFILYQLLGLVLMLLAAVLVTTSNAMLLALVSVRLGARPWRLWQAMAKMDRWFWWVRRPIATLLLAIVLAAGSALLTSGVVYNAVAKDTTLTSATSPPTLSAVRVRPSSRRAIVSWHLTKPGRLRIVVSYRSGGRWKVTRSISRDVDATTSQLAFLVRKDGGIPRPGLYRMSITVVPANGPAGPGITRRFRIER